jgi:hypothetical protein
MHAACAEEIENGAKTLNGTDNFCDIGLMAV